MRTAYRVGAILLCTACLLAAVALQQRHVDYGEHIKILRTLENGEEIHLYVKTYSEILRPPLVSVKLAGKYRTERYSTVLQRADGSIGRLLGTYYAHFSLDQPETTYLLGPVEVLDAREDGSILLRAGSLVLVVSCDRNGVGQRISVLRMHYSFNRLHGGRIIDGNTYDLDVDDKSERWQLVPKAAKSDDTARAAAGTVPATVTGTPMEAKLVWSKARGEVDGPEMRMRTSTSSNSAADGCE